MSDEMVCAAVLVSGRVQGVGYRFFTERLAAEVGVAGWSRNLADGRVELEVEGEKKRVERFIKELGVGPRMARVSDVTVEHRPYRGVHKGFSIKF
ncbi:MAG: acylphosphatase [Nitrospirae bacterium]|nr:acylphosphatase [Nitrospirota bacterium]MBI5695716.1 acylphosphatase [Nitrospirota bacterium]